ncbi:hypothetical protein [Dietzia sp. CH92]|uniref:hypothetical protein n=1 Tax=Dietzia sp. CH92 TaxID=3051823 RepID=UPI0028D7E74E|nr:hypothetical protein [Dietzia sp. CH92]
MVAAFSSGTGSRRARIALGLVRAVSIFAAAVVVVVVAALSLLAVDWAPFVDGNVGDGDRLLGGVLASWALMIAGLAWLIAVLVAWRFRQLRTWWLGAPPALFVAGVAVALAIGAAVPKGLDSSRSEMENAVAQARSHPPGWSELYGFDTPRQVGHVEVWKLSHREDGVVVVSDADFVFGFHMRGWAHSLQGPPTFEPGVKELQVEHLGGPWYSYSYVL